MEELAVTIGSEVEIQSPRPSPQPDDSVLLEECDSAKVEAGENGEVVEGGGGEGEGGREMEKDEVRVPDRLQRFYFESDALVLKNNIDYQKMLKTLALLEAQKIQATKDLEQLLVIKARALRDPVGFITAFKNGTLEPLPMRQQVAELPDVNWKGYMECVEKIVRQHSAVYQRTRRRGGGKEPATLTKMDASGSGKKSEAVKPPSYKQPWTPEEQMRLEELLRTYPPEAVERRRYEKIARALGTRTTQQVASHVQKYFIKLAKAGLPVPGRMPNVAAYGPKGKKGGRAKRLSRPSTFFSTLTPRVFMSSGGGALSPAGGGHSPTEEGDKEEDEVEEEGEREEGEEEEEEEEEEENSSDSDDSMLAEWVPTRTSSQAPISSVKCERCQVEVRYGRYWECCDCPVNVKTLLCSNCINSDYVSQHHSQSHELVPRTLSTSLADQDYSQFSQTTNSEYNYLDPNFYPAS